MMFLCPKIFFIPFSLEIPDGQDGCVKTDKKCLPVYFLLSIGGRKGS